METEVIEGSAIAVREDNQQLEQPAESGMIATKSIFDIAPGQFKKGLERRQQNRTALFEWLQANLVDKVDYGRIHVVKKDKCPHGQFCTNEYHFSKPSLWKSGAEKITGMLGLRVVWPDLEEAKHGLKRGEKVIILTCNVVNDAGQVLSEGMGARGLEADYNDINKAIKMAKKSSMIDAVINLGGMSEVFTQDVEDMDPEKICEQDPFNPHEEPTGDYFKRDKLPPLETHCPIGKDWKGKPWSEVDVNFIQWIIKTIDDKPDLVSRAKKELASRGDGRSEAERRADEAVRETGGKTLGEYAALIAKAPHIDEIIAIKDELPEAFEPGLRKFISEREKELGPQ